MKKFQMYIDGEWCDSSTKETFQVVSPIDGAVIAEVPVASKEDVERAIQAAARNKTSFRLTSDIERSELCHRISDEILKRKEELARWMTMEQGKPYETESLPELKSRLLISGSQRKISKGSTEAFSFRTIRIKRL
jgi:succinate-semialdehyde dehydrogenase/glutarate-semialdehyde dehydrogenase